MHNCKIVGNTVFVTVRNYEMVFFCFLGHRKQICTWTRQRLDSMGKPLGHGPIYDWSCEPQSLALKPASQEGNNVTSNEICYKRCHEHTTCQECLDSSGGAEGGERENFCNLF